MTNVNLLKNDILMLLYDYDNTFPINTPVEKRLLPFNDISTRIDCKNTKYILDVLHTMQDSEELHCTMEHENSKFIILELGRKRFINQYYLEIDLDFKIKKISYQSARINKTIGWYAFAISLITTLVPFIIYFIQKNDTQQVNATVPQVEKLQEKILKSMESESIYRDSLIYYIKTLNK